MRLYHGTNHMTDILKQAEYMAIRKFEQTGEGERIVIEYDFDEQIMHNGSLHVKCFDKPSKEWGSFHLG